MEKWIKEHPYYLNNPGNEYIVTIERVYGVPDDKAISESEAIKLAGTALTTHLGNAYLPDRDVRVDYLVTDPERPVWVIRFGRPRQNGNFRQIIKENPDAASLFNVTLDARTGEVLNIEATEKIY